MNETEATDQGKVIFGLIICWGWNTAEIAFAFALLAAGVDARGLVPVLIFGVGLVQLIFVLPLYYLKRRSREGETAKGIVIAASLTGLWNATCWGAVHGFFR